MLLKGPFPSIPRTAVVALSVIAGSTFELEAQTLIPNEPSCSSCRIIVEDVLRIESSPDANFPGQVTNVLVDGSGRYWVFYLNALPHVYDADGRFLRRFEPMGGPRQETTSRPSFAMTVPGDSMLIGDGGRGTFYVVGPDFGSRAIAPAQYSAAYNQTGTILSWPDRIMLASPMSIEPGGARRVNRRPDGASGSSPYHIVSLAGSSLTVSESFGEGLSGGLTSAGADGGWVWFSDPYRIERWSPTGELDKAWERRPSWWPLEQATGISLAAPPRIYLFFVNQDASGRLWTFARVPAANWQQGVEMREPAKLYRSTIEVLDPRTDRLLTSQTIDGFVVSTLSDGRAAIYEMTPAGNRAVRIVRLRMVQ